MQNLQSVGLGRRAVDPVLELREFDPLTGLATRALFRQRLDEQWVRSSAAHRPLGLLLIEIDHFRELRRSLPKTMMRQVLAKLGEATSQACKRRADLAARTRLHQLAAILADADLDGARIVAERIQKQISSIDVPAKEHPSITVSVGLAAVQPTPSHFASSLLMAADDALERAVEQGGGAIQEA